MILEELEEPGEPLTPYAQVCNEWRVFVERSTFSRLVLSSGDLDAFHAIIARRRAMVHQQVPIRHIWLRLLLAEYNCPDCERPENSEEAAANDEMFTEAMRKLLQALALLDPGRGLTLEFSAHSPSDSAHFFKSWYQLRPDYPHFATPDEHFAYVNRAKEYLPTDDKAHGYGDGDRRARWIRSIGYGSRRQHDCARRLVRPLKFDITRYARLPKARCVTDLLIRRQYFRDIDTSSLSFLLRSLPSLQVFRRENWRRFRAERRDDAASYGLPVNFEYLNAFKKRPLPPLLTTRLPRGLTHLQLFEDSDAQLYGQLYAYTPRLPRIKKLLFSLTRWTPNLKVLAVSFLTEAIDVFGLRYSYLLEEHDGTMFDEAARQTALDEGTYHFPAMESVVLTSQEHLRPDQNPNKTNAFLGAAAAVALKMPNLKTMELWSCGEGQAAVFRYEAADPRGPEPERACRLTWQSTWGSRYSDLVIEPAVLEAWGGVARARGHSPSVVFESRPLPVGVRRREYVSHYDLLRGGELKLARYVLCDTSRAQVSAEADMSPDKFMWNTEV